MSLGLEETRFFFFLFSWGGGGGGEEGGEEKVMGAVKDLSNIGQADNWLLTLPHPRR